MKIRKEEEISETTMRICKNHIIQVYKYHAKQKSDGLLSQYKPSSIALVTEISNLLYLRACEVLN